MPQDVKRFLGPGQSGSFTYESVGNAEDLHDILIGLNPLKTKFLSRFGTASDATSTNFDWFGEVLRPPKFNAHYEFEEYKFGKIPTQEGLSNYIQNFQGSGMVSDDQRGVKKVFKGKGSDPFNEAVDNAMQELGNDIENMIVNSQISCAETPGSIPRQSGGIPFFMQSATEDVTINTSTGEVTMTNINGVDKVSNLHTGDFVYFIADTMPTGLTGGKYYYIRITNENEKARNKFKLYYNLNDAISTDVEGKEIKPSDAGVNVKLEKRNIKSKEGKDLFDLEDINDVLQMIYLRGGNGDQAYMSLRNKRRFSELVNAKMTANRNGAEMSKYNDAATIYESDFGLVVAHAHHMYGDERIDILDEQYWDLKWFKRTKRVQGLPKTGTYDPFVVEAAVGVMSKAPQASGSIVNLKQ